MNILIAPNSFRDSLDAFQAAETIARAFLSVNKDFKIQKMPIADGGDFTAEILLKNKGGRWKTVTVLDALARPIAARLGILKDGTGVVELSEASGTRRLAPNELAPMHSTTFGTGQLIRAALEEGCSKIIVGLGGSATIDGGVGLLQALGVQFLDANGQEIGFGGGELHRIESIETARMDARLEQTEIIVPCDVVNYLLGNKGAVEVFAPQKGATRQEMELLEDGLTHFSLKIWELFRKDVVNLKYAGAAGGAGAGLKALLNAKLVHGSRFILDELEFDKALSRADLVVTGEGKIDFQTVAGKAPNEVAIRARRMGKTVIAFGGQIPMRGAENFDAVFSIINRPMPFVVAMQKADALLFATAKQVAAFYHKVANTKPTAKPVEQLLVLALDAFKTDEEGLEQLAFALDPLKQKEVPMLFYSQRTKAEMLHTLQHLGLPCPFIAEGGGVLYVPKGYLDLPLDAFTDNGETLLSLPFGTSRALIEGIVSKLSRLSGVPSAAIFDLSPLDAADLLDIDIAVAERLMAREFSQLILKSEDLPPLSATFRSLLQQQGLALLETETAYCIGNFDLAQPVQYFIDLLTAASPQLVTFAIGNSELDAPVLAAAQQAFLLKQNNEWATLYLDNLHLLNASEVRGLKICIEEMLKKE
jgi:glycerate 2-kinase